MATESEIQEYFEKAGALAQAGYNAAMRDGSIPAIGREAVKDVRNTIHEFFFGRGERGGEPGAPLNPLYHDIVQARASHDAAPESPAAALPPSPADLTEGTGPAAQPQVNQPQVSPADVVDHQQSRQGVAPAGLEMPAEALANARDAVAETKDALKDSPMEVGREELGQLPSQDPPRHRLGPKL